MAIVRVLTRDDHPTFAARLRQLLDADLEFKEEDYDGSFLYRADDGDRVIELTGGDEWPDGNVYLLMVDEREEELSVAQLSEHLRALDPLAVWTMYEYREERRRRFPDDAA